MVAARIALLLIALAVAAASFVHAASETDVFSLGPGTAGRLGLDAHVVGKLADRGFRAEVAARQQGGASEFPTLSDAVIEAARDSFKIDPLEVSSLRTIALGEVIQEDEESARRIMRLAARISKRDSLTNLWLAQDYSRRGELAPMLASFDHALRTSMRVREVAIKPVVEALASEQSHIPLGTLLAAHPEWENSFWGEFARNPVGTANAATFLKTTGIPLTQIPENIRQVLYRTLRRDQRYDELYALAALDSGSVAAKRSLATGRFITADGANPLGWNLYSRGGFSASVHEQTGELQVDAEKGSFGVVADRVIEGGGRHRLVIKMVEPMPSSAELELTVRCADGDRRELAGVLLRSGDRTGELEFSAVGCHYAVLELSFMSTPGSGDVFIRVAGVELQDI